MGMISSSDNFEFPQANDYIDMPIFCVHSDMKDLDKNALNAQNNLK